jgi:hypothetical protein
MGALRPASPALAARPALFELDLAPELAGRATAASWWRTGVLEAPRRFDLIGLRWARGSHAEAQVRTRRRGGPWTDWTPLHPTGDHGPDDGPAAPAGTDPAFVGTADLFQLRLRGMPRGLRARFVRALPTASVARRVGGRLRRRGTARAARAGQTAGGPPPIISRTEWGGDTVPPRAAPDYGVVQLAFVHHTVTANDYAPEDSAAIVLGIARYHRDSNKWNDIGYNFLVDKYGQIFEGRAGGIDQAVVGAQAQGYNAQSTGISCLGTYEEIAQTEQGLDALARLIGWKLSLHGVPVQGQITVISAGGSSNRYRAGTPVTLQRISGHRDGDKTSCPGGMLYGQLDALRTRAVRYAGPVPSSGALTVRAASSRVRAPRPVGVSGTMRFPDGSSPGNAPLAVEFHGSGETTWTRVADAVCGSDGVWAASVAVPASGLVRAVFAGDGSRARLESAPVRVRVLARLSMTVNRAAVRAGNTVVIKGAVLPAAEPLSLTVERRVGRRWVRQSAPPLSTRGDGAFALRLRLARAGTYRLTVSCGSVRRRRIVRAT